MFCGICPYDFVYRKFDGSIDTSKYDRPPGKLEPTLSGLGTSVSSGFEEIPAPNCNSNLLSPLTLVLYRLAVFFNFNKYGI